eukprot:TRINITY_DN17361_c0_g1_i1.p1 TRINITY_DN17361_c0_g1~~TRINITY_DN17361_c0_g1_i1.p1  ORF type:complete len:333 (-),score=85.91 TRINITY_DN17361_c0_g1_i1:52-1002(-)
MSIVPTEDKDQNTTYTWPKKTRELHTNHFNSTAWNDFNFRKDDVVIGTYAKSGTTWLQQIVCQLIFKGKEGLPIGDLSPWMDLRIPPTEAKHAVLEAQTHRRFIKTHLPVDALVFNPDIKYLYIVRDGRDVAWSIYNHHHRANDLFYDALNGPGLVGPPIGRPDEYGTDVHAYYRHWMANDGEPFWPFWDNIRSWWAIRHLPNVLMLHFNDLKKDLKGEIKKVDAFLGTGVSDDAPLLDLVVSHCEFAYMKEHSDLAAPLGGTFWVGGSKDFMHKGTNSRWKDVLSTDEVDEYKKRSVAELGEECAKWLELGGERA